MKRSFFAIAVSLWTFFYVVALHAAAPSIPAHARFQDSQTYRQKHAGQLLVEELNCVSCHASELPLNAKQAPVLTEVMTRAKAAHLLKFIQTPHETKPGTSMPNVQVSAEQADALLHFLGSLSAAEPPQEYANFGGQRRGEKLFHSVGCVACHDPVGKDLQTSVPLGDLPAKYTLASLAQFLKNPLHARPSGRMPSMNLSMRESKDIAAFLLPDTPEKAGIEYEYYELDSPQRLPDFDALTPVASGGTERFDVRKHSKRADNFGLRYSGILQVEQEGEYRFMLGSDDGSKLIIDDKVVINNDGEHGMVRKNARITLSPGRHAVQVEYFEKGGGEELVVTFRPPGGKSGPLDVELVASAPAQPLEDLRFTVDPQKGPTRQRIFCLARMCRLSRRRAEDREPTARPGIERPSQWSRLPRIGSGSRLPTGSNAKNSGTGVSFRSWQRQAADVVRRRTNPAHNVAVQLFGLSSTRRTWWRRRVATGVFPNHTDGNGHRGQHSPAP